MFDPNQQPQRTDDPVAPQPAERMMRITPMDMRQQRFKQALRGYDRTEVVAFLTEAADDYEHAMREMDRLRGDLARMEALLAEHRQRENNLRDTLLTAQKVTGELKENAQNEAKLIVREAQGRADMLLQKAQVRLEEIDREINELRLRRRDTEGSLESSIQALYRALEFVRDQDQARAGDEKVLLHRPRQAELPSAAPGPQLEERKASSCSGPEHPGHPAVAAHGRGRHAG
jgi:cell division initiation protein